MHAISRRDLVRYGALLVPAVRRSGAAVSLEDTLRTGVKQRSIPGAAGMVASADKTTWSGAFGACVAVNSIFRIASMTKVITTTAAMQLVEQGKLSVDEPVAKHLPALEKVQVLEGFDADGKPKLRSPRQLILLRQLLTHTAGFAYDGWDANLKRYLETHKGVTAPLVFEPGARWEYGTNIDWAGRLVEAISGLTLEDYFQRHILQPLGMQDTSFILPRQKFDRLVGSWQRQADGSLKAEPRTFPAAPKAFNGGGGLYSTAGDYVRFMQMFLRRGKSPEGRAILRPESIDRMMTNQVGSIDAGKLKTTRPERSADVDFHPGHTDGFTFGFLINREAYAGGRSAGSLAWAGLLNTFFWIDPKAGICATLLMQFLPFCDPQAIGLLRDFENAVYATRRG
jgi:CubicO group peptidase (beta-lactamase class C family)